MSQHHYRHNEGIHHFDLQQALRFLHAHPKKFQLFNQHLSWDGYQARLFNNWWIFQTPLEDFQASSAPCSVASLSISLNGIARSIFAINYLLLMNDHLEGTLDTPNDTFSFASTYVLFFHMMSMTLSRNTVILIYTDLRLRIRARS